MPQLKMEERTSLKLDHVQELSHQLKFQKSDKTSITQESHQEQMDGTFTEHHAGDHNENMSKNYNNKYIFSHTCTLLNIMKECTSCKQ